MFYTTRFPHIRCTFGILEYILDPTSFGNPGCRMSNGIGWGVFLHFHFIIYEPIFSSLVRLSIAAFGSGFELSDVIAQKYISSDGQNGACVVWRMALLVK
jgi:hypothetical protein